MIPILTDWTDTSQVHLWKVQGYCNSWAEKTHLTNGRVESTIHIIHIIHIIIFLAQDHSWYNNLEK